MRRIGTLSDEADARRFCDFLFTQSIDAAFDPSIESSSEAGPGNKWDIWIREEKDVESARNEFLAFQQDPASEKYEVGGKAEKLRHERVAAEQKRLEEQKKLRRSMPASSTRMPGAGLGASVPGRQQRIPVVIGIIAISVVASFSSNFGKLKPTVDLNNLSTEARVYFGMSFVDQRDYLENRDPLASVRKGEVWRFITPMFLHGDPMHLAFNMIWVFMLGSAIERQQGSLFLALLILGTHFVGMLLQITLPDAASLPPILRELAGSPFVIGASGGVYGLVGYLWIRPKVDPDYPLQLSQNNIYLMLGWLVLCMTPIIADVANGAHVGGLIGGIAIAMAFGYFSKDEA